jgi:hypothetical protein
MSKMKKVVFCPSNWIIEFIINITSLTTTNQYPKPDTPKLDLDNLAVIKLIAAALNEYSD